MDRMTLTTVVIFSVSGLLVLYDVWAAFRPGATISERMLDMGHRHPIIPFALGILMGHFFWSQAAEAKYQAPPPGSEAWPGPVPDVSPVLLWLGLACLLIGILLAIFVR